MADKQKEKTNGKRGFRFGRFFLWTFLVLMVISCALPILLFKTQTGVRILENTLNTFLNKEGRPVRVEIAGLGGNLPFDLHIGHVEAKDQEGIFFVGNHLVLSLSPLDLFRGRIHIKELSGNNLALYRKPLLPASIGEKPKKNKDFSLPTLPEILADKIRIEKFFIGESLVGEETVLHLEGFLTNNQEMLSLLFSVNTVEGLPLELSLEAGFKHKNRLLDLKGNFSEKSGRLTTLLKMPPLPLSLTLDGSGEPGEWLGGLHFTMGEKSSLITDLKITWEKKWPSVEFNGNLAIDPDFLPGTTDPFLMASEIKGGVFEDPGKKGFFSFLTLQNDKLELDFKGGFLHEKKEIEADLNLAVVNPSGLSPITSLSPGSEILLQAHAGGKLQQPELHGKIILADPSFDKLRIRRLEIQNTLKLFPGKDEKPELYCFGMLEARGLSFGEKNAPSPVRTNFELVYQTAEKNLSLKHFEIGAKDLLARLKGEILQAGGIDAELELESENLAPWLALLTDMPVSGRGRMSAQMKGALSPPILDLAILSSLENLTGLPDPIPGLVGEKLTLQAKTRVEKTLSEDFRFGILDLKMDSPTFTLKADGFFSGRDKNLFATTELKIPDLVPLLPKTGLTGGVGMHGKVEGTLDAFSFDIDLSSKDFSSIPTGRLPFFLTFTGDKKNTETKGRLAFETESPDIPASLLAEFLLEDKKLLLPGLEAVFPGGSLLGNGEADLEGPAITASIKGVLEDAAKIGTLAGLSAQGNGNFTLNLFHSETGQTLEMNAQFSSLGLNALELEHLEVRGVLQDLFGKKHLEANYLAKKFDAGSLFVEESAGKIHGNLSSLSFATKSRGEAFEAFQLDVKGKYEPQEKLQKITLTNLNGTWSEFPFHLEKNWILSLKNGGIHMEPLQFRFEEASIHAQGFLESRKLKLELLIDNFPVHAIPLETQGRFQASLDMEGSPAAPVLRLDFAGKNILPQNTTYYDGPGINSFLHARIMENHLSFETRLHEIPEDQPFFKGEGKIPLIFSLQPFRFAFPKENPVQANFQGRANLERLGRLFMPVTQLIRGDLEVNLALSGKLARPVLAGDITLGNGSYQHLEQGIFLQDLRTLLQFSPEKIEIRYLTARDINGGNLEGKGEIRLAPKENFPFEAVIKTGAFQIMHSADILAALKNAEISFAGDSKKQELKGEITLERVEYFIRDFGGPSIPKLKVTEIPDPEGETEKKVRKRQRPFSPRLNLAIHVPSRLFVRGRGLDSEWRGSLNILGVTHSPVIRGSIELVRGRLDFLGKRLKLEEGKIVLDGSRPPNPYVSVEAQRDSKEVLSILKIEGQPENLKFTLSSEPTLPEDEILSQMLFGRSVSAISPLQAAQLAWAIGELSGVTDGPGVFGMARDALGLDDLNLVSDGDDPDDIRLRAGKYIHERVYLRAEKDLKTDDDLISADVELTRRLSFESKLGPKGGGVGLYWKRDY